MFACLRRRGALENCLVAARAGDTDTLAAVLGSGAMVAVREHWLPVLASLPETLAPARYAELLPGVEAGLVPELWTGAAREEDWAESVLAGRWSGHLPGGPASSPDALYSSPDMAAVAEFRCPRPTPALVSRWYEVRARQVCRQACLPDLALDLLQAGLERGAAVDWRLLHHLRTLDCLVYEVQAAAMELAALEQLEPVEQMKLLLGGWEAAPLHTVRCHLVPFLQRLEDHSPGRMGALLHGFCTALAATDLTFPLLVVEHSGPDKAGPILYSVVDTVRLALDCCYALGSGAQLELMGRMLESVAVFVRTHPQTGLTRYNVSAATISEVEGLRHHLEVASVLARNGVARPLSLLRDSATEPAVMEKLFSAVLARAEGARPALEAEDWRLVLRDLQLLQTMLPVVAMEGVLYSYCESLLSSGVAANIDLAGPVMEGMLEGEEQERLVLTAWRHYYSTAGGLADPSLDLARKVVGLLQPTPRALDHCYDLLAALQSMQDFDLGHVLPLTILETRDRLKFVRLAVEGSSKAYRNSQRLMKLASLLGVAAGAMEGEVWAVIAAKALALGDTQAALAACFNMVRLVFTGGWQVCYTLAARPDVVDLERCAELLAFAVCHCPGEHIVAVMEAIVVVEHRRLEQGLAVRVQGGQEEEEEWEDTVEEVARQSRGTTPVDQLMSVPAISSQLLARHSGQLWQRSASWLARLSSTALVTSVHEDLAMDTAFEVVRMPAFYLGPESAEVEGGLELTYSSYDRPPLPHDLALASYQVLRLGGAAATLAVFLGEKEVEGATPALLQQVVPLVASQDLHLGLGLLVTLSTPEEVSEALATLPKSLPGICLSLTTFCLLLLAPTIPLTTLLELTPRQIVAKALAMREEEEGSATGPTKACLSFISEQLELLGDHQQAAVLAGLAEHVDVARFTADSQYKEDTILGLAMDAEEERWQFVLTLVTRYHLAPALLAVTHLQALLTDPAATTGRVAALAEERGLVEMMGRPPAEVARSLGMLETKVLPLLDGADTARMLLYYRLVARVGGKVEHHIAALNRLTTAAVTVDYNLIVSRSGQLLDLLTAENVEVVAELVEEVGCEGEGVTGSSVLGAWAAKVFMEHGLAKENWIEAFSQSLKFVERVEPREFEGVVRRCILSQAALAAVPRPARGRIFKKAVKQVEVMMVGEPERWRGTLAWLAGVKAHSEKFRSALSVRVVEELGERLGEVVDRFEMTGGDEVEVVRLLATFLVEGRPLPVVEAVMQLWKQQEQVEGAWEEVVGALAGQVRGQGQVVAEPLALLERLAPSLPAALLSRLLAPLVTEDQVAIKDRLAIVHILKQLGEGEEVEADTVELAELYQTQHELQQVLPELEVTREDLESADSRRRLLGRLLASCSSAVEVAKVAELSGGWEVEGRVFMVASRLLKIDPKEVVELLEGEEDLSEDAAVRLVEEGEVVMDTVVGAHIVLKLGVEERFDQAIQVRLLNMRQCQIEVQD